MLFQSKDKGDGAFLIEQNLRESLGSRGSNEEIPFGPLDKLFPSEQEVIAGSIFLVAISFLVGWLIVSVIKQMRDRDA